MLFEFSQKRKEKLQFCEPGNPLLIHIHTRTYRASVNSSYIIIINLNSSEFTHESTTITIANYKNLCLACSIHRSLITWSFWGKKRGLCGDWNINRKRWSKRRRKNKIKVDNARSTEKKDDWIIEIVQKDANRSSSSFYFNFKWYRGNIGRTFSHRVLKFCFGFEFKNSVILLWYEFIENHTQTHTNTSIVEDRGVWLNARLLQIWEETAKANMQKNTRKVAPDGGWGWMACFGVSLVNVSIANVPHQLHHIIGTFQ